MSLEVGIQTEEGKIIKIYQRLGILQLIKSQHKHLRTNLGLWQCLILPCKIHPTVLYGLKFQTKTRTNSSRTHFVFKYWTFHNSYSKSRTNSSIGSTTATPRQCTYQGKLINQHFGTHTSNNPDTVAQQYVVSHGSK